MKKTKYETYSNFKELSKEHIFMKQELFLNKLEVAFVILTIALSTIIGIYFEVVL